MLVQNGAIIGMDDELKSRYSMLHENGIAGSPNVTNPFLHI